MNFLTNLKAWHFLVLSVILSEILTSIMSYLLRGRITGDYLITGGVVSLIVASLVIFLITQNRKLLSERNGLQDKLTERMRVESALKQSLCERETLVKEIHHRVKNNLVMVQALLELQSHGVKDEGSKAAFAESQERIASMGMIHEHLYSSEDIKHMNISDYIERLARKLIDNYRSVSGDVRLDLDLEEVYLDVEVMIPCGLILNELITNSLKHAFPAGRAGSLYVGLRRGSDSAIALRVRDDGPGMPEGFELQRAQSMGMKIMSTLTAQLRGQLELGGSGGTEAVLSFRA